MPRGRTRKPRLSRMDAAVDAMVPFGFPEASVRKVVKQLLKEYGGDEGWPFIEECAYKELIEALLRNAEEDDQAEAADTGNQQMADTLEDEIPTGTSTRDSDTQQDGGPEDSAPTDVAMSSDTVAEPTCSKLVSSSSETNNDGKGWKDILPDQSCLAVEKTAADPVKHKNDETNKAKMHPPPGNSSLATRAASPSLKKNVPSPPPPTNSVLRRRRFPCYGWISSDEEENAPREFIFLTPMVPPRLFRSPRLGTKRKSRWDQGPHDP